MNPAREKKRGKISSGEKGAKMSIKINKGKNDGAEKVNYLDYYLI